MVGLLQLYPSHAFRSCSTPSSPRCLYSAYSSFPSRELNAENQQPPLLLLASHGAIRSLQQAPLSRQYGSQRGGISRRRVTVSSRGLAGRHCGCYQGTWAHLCSSFDNSISLTTTGGVEEEHEEEEPLQAMPSNYASGAAVGEEGGGGVNNSYVSRSSSLDLLPNAAGLTSGDCGAFRSANEGPVSSEEACLVPKKAFFSPNVISKRIHELGAGLFSGNQEAVVKQALMISVVGLQVCSGAWAGTEVAQINVKSGLGLGDVSDIQSGFASAFLLIFFSEIGDKTFFIAALLATRKSSIAVFSGTFGALMAMTVISVCLGRAFHYIDGILPSFGLDTKLPVDDIAAVILLVYFGVSTLLDAYYMDENGEEQQEAELAIADVGVGGAVAGTVAATFALVFVAEWGDKSFFSTIALAAASSPLGVVTGAIAGHGAATLLAVLGGSFLGNYVSEKVIAYVGGALFLVFAGATLVEILN